MHDKLKNTVKHIGINNRYTFKDLVDIDKLQPMFENFSNVTGFTCGIVSYPDQEHKIVTGWKDICLKFHRVNPKSGDICKASNQSLTENLTQLKDFNIHTCANGLVDGATPFIIKGNHIANIFCGQVLIDKPDIEYFRKQAELLGFDSDTYLNALQKVPIVSESQLKSALSFLSDMAILIAEQALANLDTLSKLSNIKTQRDLSKKLSEAMTLDEALTTCLETAIRIAGADSGGIYLVDQKDGGLNLMRETGLSDEFLESRKYYKADSNPASIIHAGEPLYIPFDMFETVFETVLADSQKKEGLRSLAVLPVQSEGKSIACINIAYHESDEIPMEVRDLLESTIYQIATVLAKTISYEAIKVSEDKFRAIFDQTYGFIGLMNPDGILLNANKTALNFANLKESDVVNKPFWEAKWWAHSKDLQNQLRDAIQRAASGEFIRFEAQHPGPDGIHILDVSIKPVTDDAGSVIYLIPEGRDITHLKHAEEALKVSENKFRSIVESSPMGIHMYELQDDDDRLVFIGANPSADIILNVDNSIFIGKTIEEAFPPLAETEIPDRYRAAAAKGVPWKTEQITYEEGLIKGAFDVIAFQTTPGKMVALFNDITSRKQALQALQQSENKLRRIIDIVPSIIFAKNAEGRFLIANKAIAEFFGMSVEELTGKLQSEIFRQNPAEADKMYANDKLALESNKVIIIPEEEYTDSHGLLRYMHTTLVPCSDEIFGEPALVGLSTDITEWKEREKEVQRLRNLLNNIINSMPSILVGIDTKGIITQWNREAENTTGIMAEKALGNNLASIYPQLADELEKVKVSIHKRQAHEETKVARTVDGEIRYENITVFPLVDNGIEGAVIRVDDITEKVRIEEMMIQSEKMLSVGGLAAGMAHEINNPLAGMMQNAAVVLYRLTEDLPANIKAATESGTTMTAVQTFMKKRNIIQLLEMIHSSGVRAAKIVQNMLSFARKSDSKNIPINLPELLDQTIELIENDYDLKKKYDFRQIEIIREYQQGVPDVPCEASKIQQVLLNIIKNGAEAMNDYFSEKKRKDNPCFIVRLLQEKKMVRVEIQDNGPGIEKKILKRIYEPFFSTKGVGAGMGLGLSVSYFIITENHGGTLTVESSPGKGARFIIRLPLGNSEKDNTE